MSLDTTHPPSQPSVSPQVGELLAALQGEMDRETLHSP